jgi:uncharacterized DUF497 family protein
MDILCFDWDSTNIGHIAEHDVVPEEPEQVIGNRPLDLGTELRNGEERFANLGETDAGRVLVVITTRLASGVIRVVTAWPAKERLRRYFGSHKEAGSAGRVEAENVRE